MTLDEFLETLNDDLDVELAQLITFARELERHNTAMRDAIREASRQLEFALDMWRQHHNNSGDERPPDLKSLPTIEGERWNEGRATLIKLQPFITP